MDSVSTVVTGFWQGFGFTFGVIAAIVTIIAAFGAYNRTKPPGPPKKQKPGG